MNDTTILKICTKCKEEKQITEFYIDRSRKDLHNVYCKECYKGYYVLNRDMLCAKTRDWSAKNRERKSEADKAYYEANKEKCNALGRVWKLENKELVRIYNRNRRARKEVASGTHTASDIRQILSLQKSKCAVCKTKLSSGYHVDHVIALANGGSNDKYNLQILCQPCNNSKHAKDPIYFMQSRGFLL